MSVIPLALLLCAVSALAGLGAVGTWPPRPARRRGAGAARPPAFMIASTVTCAMGFAVLLLVAITPGTMGTIQLGGGVGVTLDALNLVPLVILLGTALAGLAFGCSGEADAAPREPLLGPLAAFWALSLLAADALTLMLGLMAASLTLWVIAGRRGAFSPPLLAALLAGLACLLLAFDLLIGAAGLSFAALRAAPPSGWRAGLMLFATLAAIMLHAFRIPGLKLPALTAGLVGAAFPAIAAYVLIRVLLDLAGPAQPLAWGVPILLLGNGLAVAGAWRAISPPDLTGTLTATTTAQLGLSLIGIGAVAMARAADQPDLAAFALAATLMQLLAHAAFKILLLLGAAAVRTGAGTESYAALGGVSRGMPRTTACLVTAAASLAALPLSAGFVGLWSLLQALFAAGRLGGGAVQLLVLGSALAVAAVGALLAFAAARLVGVGLLGRPRTPRAAAAMEPSRAALHVLLALAALCLVLGVWPAPLFGLAAPAVRALTATQLSLAETWLAIAPPLDTAGYQPLGIGALLVGLAAIAWLLRRFSPPVRSAPGWAGGYAAPPPWLPFGDPALQLDATAFSDAVATAAADAGAAWAGAIDAAAPRLRHTSAARIARWRPALQRYRLALGVAALVLLLLALAVIEAA